MFNCIVNKIADRLNKIVSNLHIVGEERLKKLRMLWTDVNRIAIPLPLTYLIVKNEIVSQNAEALKLFLKGGMNHENSVLV